ncbi:hypothetical protein HZA73_03445 [candidate division TA06 bacterium]|nr:hypothetical protein [candidate division TA06 bacterium]
MKPAKFVLFVFSFVAVLSFYAQAQDIGTSSMIIGQKYDSLYQYKSIRTLHTFWSGPKLLINGDTYSLKYMSDIGKPFKSVMSEYKYYQSSNRIKNISFTTAFILYCAAFIPQSKDNPSNSDYTLSLSLLAGSLVSIIIGGINEIAEANHMEKTIWLYNREVMRPQITISDTLNQ